MRAVVPAAAPKVALGDEVSARDLVLEGAASFRAHRVAAHAWAEAAEARDAESRVVLLRRAASQQAIT